MFSDVALVAIGLIALFVGGDLLVRGAARLANALGISAIVVGLTVVAVGTSAPELVVSISAALQGTTDIAVGNVIGSNIANIGLILGLTVVLMPVAVERRFIRREIPLLLVITVSTYLLAIDGLLSRLDGVLMTLGFIAFSLYSYLMARRDQRQIEVEIREFEELEGIGATLVISRRREVVRLSIGIVLLALGAQWTVDGATAIARAAGISDLIIGVTIIAVGTSLPELSAALVAALRRENDLVIGNIVGSNIANLLLILGLTATIKPAPISDAVRAVQFPIMLGFTMLLILFISNRLLQRREGVVFLVAYSVFIITTFII